jgi:methyl-accepting chemotaxis protein
MDQVTQQNAALVEEASAAAQSLQEQAQGLSEAVSVFKVGQRAAAPAEKASAVLAANRLPAPRRAGNDAPALQLSMGAGAPRDWAQA